MANDWRSLLIDLQISGQLAAFKFHGWNGSRGGQVKRVGSDYVVFSLYKTGTIAIPLSRLEFIDLSPEMNGDGTTVEPDDSEVNSRV